MSTEAKIPVVEQQDPKSAAAKLLEAAFARDEESAEVKAIVAAESIWCYSCDRHRQHFGIFFTKDPRGRQTFGPGDWYSAYHDNREAFDFEIGDIVCQQCFADTGERVPLRVGLAPSPDRKSGLHFRIQESWMQRFAFEVRRVDMEAWLEKKKAKTQKAEPNARAKQPA